MKTAVSMLGSAPRATRTLGAILIDSGQLTARRRRARPAVSEAAATCASARRRCGSASISEADIQFALSRQFAYAYLRKTPGRAAAARATSSSRRYQPFSPRVEQLRAIRSQLMLRWFDRAEERQVLTIVGAERGEGRSYLAANLADRLRRSSASARLLVDADMRDAAPALSVPSLENQIGFSTLLAGPLARGGDRPHPDLAGLSVLPAGPTPPNPLELLNRLNFEEFMIAVRRAPTTSSSSTRRR